MAAYQQEQKQDGTVTGCSIVVCREAGSTSMEARSGLTWSCLRDSFQSSLYRSIRLGPMAQCRPVEKLYD